MSRSFKQGVVMGILGPLVFLGGIVYWVYRYTKRIPFPVRRTEAGEVAVRLVEPEEVPTYWQQWKEELAPLFDRLVILVAELREICLAERDKIAKGKSR